jgi:2-dehydro-3-deoxygalactonokinase
MTGEIYELLRKHSILHRFMPGDQEGHHDEDAFREGVQLALDEPALLHSLFSVRTQALFSQKPHTSLDAYLSGILIGSEISGEAPGVSKNGSTIVIATPELGRLYHDALVAAGFADIRVVDAETAVAQGLWSLWQLQGAAS